MSRVERVVSEGRVKVHVFEPSGRRIWTVVGNEEHWVDPLGGHCSCPGFYFGSLRGSMECYHLESARQAARSGREHYVTFSDDEFEGFLAGLIADMRQAAIPA